MGGGFGVAGTAVTALAFLIAAASLGYLVKKGADWLRQKIDMLRLAKSEGKISAKDRVEIMAAIEKLKLARYRSEAIGRGDAEGETIKAAALRLGGQVFTGRDHLVAYDKVNPHGKLTQGQMDNLEDGFVTSTGRFVDRHEAARIAKAARQYGERQHYRQPGTPEGLLAEETKDWKRSKRGDIQIRGDFWKKPETGASLAKPAQSSPTEIGAFLNKAQQTKPSAATNAPAAGPAATAVAPSPAVAASGRPVKPSKAALPRSALGERVFGQRKERKAITEPIMTEARAKVQSELAKHPQTKPEYKRKKQEWRAADKKYRQHERAYNAFETETPPPGSAEARALEAKNQQKAQAAQAKVTATQQKTAQRAALKTQKAEAGKLKRHQKQYLAYERNDPPPGSGAYRRHHQKFGTLPQQPGEARPVAAG